MNVVFRPITSDDATQILGWRYLAPYDRYDLVESDRAGLLNPTNGYFVADDEDGLILGFCCFGPDARVRGGSYGVETGLDVGAGLRPDATGRGLGSAFIAAALKFGMERYGAHRFGATVAAFNERAQRAAEQAGLRPIARFAQSGSDTKWVQLVADIP